MKKAFIVSLVVVIIAAIGINIIGNKIQEAYNQGFNDAINNAVVSVVKVASDVYEVRLEIQGDLYVHIVDSIEEEVPNDAY